MQMKQELFGLDDIIFFRWMRDTMDEFTRGFQEPI